MAEINTGIWADAKPEKREWELERVKKAVDYAIQIGLKVTAGHGITYHSVKDISRINGIYELSIGHSIISRAVFSGLSEAVREMKDIILRESER